MAKSKSQEFKVEAVLPTNHNTILLRNVVLVPADPEDSPFGKNPLARVELTRLTTEQAADYKPGAKVTVSID